MNRLSIIIPCRNEERYIAACLDSVLQATYPQEKIEIIVVDGRSQDATREIIRNYTECHSFIRLVDNPEKITPVALNLGIKASSGEYIIRLDAHAKYPKDYFERLVFASIRLNASNVGAVCHVETINKNHTTSAIKNVLGDCFGVGNSLFRIGASEIVKVDTVPFGCFRRDTFGKYGLFDERLVRNQDVEFNKRIIRGGGEIYLIPDLVCTYFARETYKELWCNNFKNGYWNIMTSYYTGTFRSLSLRHFVPLVFVLGIIAPAVTALFFPPLIWGSVVLLGLYLSVISMRSVLISENNCWIYQVSAFIVLHFSYGFGGIGGVLSVLKRDLIASFSYFAKLAGRNGIPKG